MFSGCEALESFTFGDNFDTSGVTAMYFMFSGCSSLTELDLSGFDTSSVTGMYSMFSGCEALKSLTFGDDFDTSSVTDMNNMFWVCYALTSLDLTGFTFADGVNCAEMFGYVGQDYATETNSKTQIYVTQEGYNFLSDENTNTYIDAEWAELKVKTSAE